MTLVTRSDSVLEHDSSLKSCVNLEAHSHTLRSAFGELLLKLFVHLDSGLADYLPRRKILLIVKMQSTAQGRLSVLNRHLAQPDRYSPSSVGREVGPK